MATIHLLGALIVLQAPPVTTFPEPFTLIQGIYELRDRRVLISDWIEGRLVVLDFDRGTSRDLGRVGGGPEEFRLPGRLVGMPGDSVLLVDVGNARFSILDPNLKFTRTMSAQAPGGAYSINPRAVDASGNFYFTIPGWAAGPNAPPSDSVTVARWKPGDNQVTPVARIQGSTRRRGPSREMNLPYVVFAPQDAWAAAPDGRIAIVRSGDYHVEWIDPNGTVLAGPPVNYVPVRTTLEDRKDHIRRFLASSAQSGRGADGGMGLVPASSQTDEEIDALARRVEYVEEFPPFEAGKVWVVGSEVWVQRALPADSLPTLDVFDGRGVQVRRVTLPLGREVLLVVARAIYAGRRDESDLLFLERYPTNRGAGETSFNTITARRVPATRWNASSPSPRVRNRPDRHGPVSHQVAFPRRRVQR